MRGSMNPMPFIGHPATKPTVSVVDVPKICVTKRIAAQMLGISLSTLYNLINKRTKRDPLKITPTSVGTIWVGEMERWAKESTEHGRGKAV